MCGPLSSSSSSPRPSPLAHSLVPLHRPQHDAQLDYYGRRLATASSDRSIRIFDVEADDSYRLADSLQASVLSLSRSCELLCLETTSLTSLHPPYARSHDGPVHALAWAHPSFGSILASCSFDGKVLIWKENDAPNKGWSNVKEHLLHTASGALSCPPSSSPLSSSPPPRPAALADPGSLSRSQRHRMGTSRARPDPRLRLVRRQGLGPHLQQCVSRFPPHLLPRLPHADPARLVLADDGTWEASLFPAHAQGVTSVSWAPAVGIGALTSAGGAPPQGGAGQGGEGQEALQQVKRFATGGCDGLVKIWAYKCVLARLLPLLLELQA